MVKLTTLYIIQRTSIEIGVVLSEMVVSCCFWKSPPLGHVKWIY